MMNVGGQAEWPAVASASVVSCNPSVVGAGWWGQSGAGIAAIRANAAARCWTHGHLGWDAESPAALSTHEAGNLIGLTPTVAPDDGEPQVTIKHRGEAKIEEYSVHGRVYMIKITPSKGKPYYLVDSRGDGQFTRQDNLDSGTRPPMWIIHSW